MCIRDRLKIEGDTCCIRLKNDYGGVSRLDDMQGFGVAGADKVFHPAKASYDNAKGIVVTLSLIHIFILR